MFSKEKMFMIFISLIAISAFILSLLSYLKHEEKHKTVKGNLKVLGRLEVAQDQEFQLGNGIMEIKDRAAIDEMIPFFISDFQTPEKNTITFEKNNNIVSFSDPCNMIKLESGVYDLVFFFNVRNGDPLKFIKGFHIGYRNYLTTPSKIVTPISFVANYTSEKDENYIIYSQENVAINADENPYLYIFSYLIPEKIDNSYKLENVNYTITLKKLNV